MYSASSILRKLGWFVAAAAVGSGLLFGSGIFLNRLKISIEAHPMLAVLLGPHGIVYGLVLPLLIYSLLFGAALWITAWLVRAFRLRR